MLDLLNLPIVEGAANPEEVVFAFGDAFAKGLLAFPDNGFGKGVRQ